MCPLPTHMFLGIDNWEVEVWPELNIMTRDREFLESLVAEVEKNVDGKRVQVEGEDDVEGEKQS